MMVCSNAFSAAYQSTSQPVPHFYAGRTVRPSSCQQLHGCFSAYQPILWNHHSLLLTIGDAGKAVKIYSFHVHMIWLRIFRYNLPDDTMIWIGLALNDNGDWAWDNMASTVDSADPRWRRWLVYSKAMFKYLNVPYMSIIGWGTLDLWRSQQPLTLNRIVQYTVFECCHSIRWDANSACIAGIQWEINI